MTPADLDAIRARDADYVPGKRSAGTVQAKLDRRALLAHVDALAAGRDALFASRDDERVRMAGVVESLTLDLIALRAAARKVVCTQCDNGGLVQKRGQWVTCPDCADLRALLGEKP